MTKTSQERFQVSSENGGSDAMWNNVGTRGGGHTGQVAHQPQRRPPEHQRPHVCLRPPCPGPEADEDPHRHRQREVRRSPVEAAVSEMSSQMGGDEGEARERRHPPTRTAGALLPVAQAVASRSENAAAENDAFGMNPRQGASLSATPKSRALRLEVRTTAGASTPHARTAATSSPERSGSRTSRSTAVGRNSTAERIPEAPSTASPTTMNPDSSSTRRANRRKVG